MSTDRPTKSLAAVASVLIGILLIYLTVLLTGNELPLVGGQGISVVYSILVYVPVLLMCIAALVKATRGRA